SGRLLPGSRRRARRVGRVGDDRAARIRAHEDDGGRRSGAPSDGTRGGGGGGRPRARAGGRERGGGGRAALGGRRGWARPPPAVPQAPCMTLPLLASPRHLIGACVTPRA